MLRQGMGYWLTVVQRLLQCIEHEVRMHAMAAPPDHDAPGIHVHNEGQVQPSLAKWRHR